MQKLTLCCGVAQVYPFSLLTWISPNSLNSVGFPDIRTWQKVVDEFSSSEQRGLMGTDKIQHKEK